MNHITSPKPRTCPALAAEAHRLLFEIEAAERRGAHLAERRYKARYHDVMAELHALSAERHSSLRGEFRWASRDHQSAAMQFRGDMTTAGVGV